MKIFTDKYKDALLDGTQYSGSIRVGKARLSASGVTEDILPIVLRYRYPIKADNKIKENTFGSLLQLGVDKLFEDEKFVKKNFGANYHAVNAYRMNHKMKVGKVDWIFSGEIDQLIINEETKEMFIVDNKLMKYDSLTRLTKERKKEELADKDAQLNSYRYLLSKDEKYKEYTVKGMYLAFFFKDGSFFTRELYPHFKMEEVKPIDDFEDIIINKMEEINPFIANKSKKPEQCSSLLWSRAYGEKAKPIKCHEYCDSAHACPYFVQQKARTGLGSLLKKRSKPKENQNKKPRI